MSSDQIQSPLLVDYIFILHYAVMILILHFSIEILHISPFALHTFAVVNDTKYFFPNSHCAYLFSTPIL